MHDERASGSHTVFAGHGVGLDREQWSCLRGIRDILYLSDLSRNDGGNHVDSVKRGGTPLICIMANIGRSYKRLLRRRTPKWVSIQHMVSPNATARL